MDAFVKFHPGSNLGRERGGKQSPGFPINLIDQTEEKKNLLLFQLWELQWDLTNFF